MEVPSERSAEPDMTTYIAVIFGSGAGLLGRRCVFLSPKLRCFLPLLNVGDYLYPKFSARPSPAKASIRALFRATIAGSVPCTSIIWPAACFKNSIQAAVSRSIPRRSERVERAEHDNHHHRSRFLANWLSDQIANHIPRQPAMATTASTGTSGVIAGH